MLRQGGMIQPTASPPSYATSIWVGTQAMRSYMRSSCIAKVAWVLLQRQRISILGATSVAGVLPWPLAQ
jgi:hypothetical protein